MLADRGPELVDALARLGHGGDDGRQPGVVIQVRQLQHRAQVVAGLGHARPVGLVDDEDVGDLQQAGLVGLHAVSPPRVHHHHGGIGGGRDLHLDLAHPDRLDHHPRKAGRVEHPQRLRGRQGEAAEMTAGGHRADEHLRVEGVVLHPDPVPEDGAPAERGGRVDGEHRHLGVGGAGHADEPVGERRLPCSRRPGDPHRVGRTAERPGVGTDLPGGGAAPLHQAQGSGQRTPVAGVQQADQLGGIAGGGHGARQVSRAASSLLRPGPSPRPIGTFRRRRPR